MTYFISNILCLRQHLILARHLVCSASSHQNDVEITTDPQSPEVPTALLSWSAADSYGVWFGFYGAGITKYAKYL
jgi:hypothetical protein